MTWKKIPDFVAFHRGLNVEKGLGGWNTAPVPSHSTCHRTSLLRSVLPSHLTPSPTLADHMIITGHGEHGEEKTAVWPSLPLHLCVFVCQSIVHWSHFLLWGSWYLMVNPFCEHPEMLQRLWVFQTSSSEHVYHLGSSTSVLKSWIDRWITKLLDLTHEWDKG